MSKTVVKVQVIYVSWCCVKGAADAADNLSLYRDTNHGTKPQTEKGKTSPSAPSVCSLQSSTGPKQHSDISLKPTT